MSFVKKILGPDETLIGITSAHWIYGATGIVWLGGMMIIGLVLNFYATGFFDYLFRDSGAPAVAKIADALFWMATSLGVVMFFFYFLMMISLEVGLTSRRIIYKRGLIFVDVKEVDLEEIKAADVNNGWFGRFLNYGYVLLDARFVTGVDLPAIAKPYRFVNALNEARGEMKHDSMTVIVDGVGDSLKQEVGDAVKKEMSEQESKQSKKKKEKEPEAKQAAKTPKLSDADNNDHLEHEPRGAVKGVIEEAKDNLKHAIGGKVLVPPSEKKKRGPLLFNSRLLQREKWLRSKIKDNFAETSE
ncbi:MAG: PH domain-containing protein [Alphaproteobacteria bacterium]